MQLCNSRAHEQFVAFKRKATEERREERLKKTDMHVITLKEIADKITQSQMVPGKSHFQPLTALYVDARGRGAALLTGRESKKRRWEESIRGREQVALQSQIVQMTEETNQLKTLLLEARQVNNELE